MPESFPFQNIKTQCPKHLFFPPPPRVNPVNPSVEAHIRREERELRMKSFSERWRKILDAAQEKGALGDFEKQHAHRFCSEWLSEAFGLKYEIDFRVEFPVHRGRGHVKWADCLVGKDLLIEMKSPNEDLQAAFIQAKERYWDNLPNDSKPPFIITCDFLRFHVFDMRLQQGEMGDLFASPETQSPCQEFKLEDLPRRINREACFQPFIPHEQFLRPDLFEDSLELNRKAAEMIGNLHRSLAKSWPSDRRHDLEILLVRLVFCLFAEDRGDIFPSGSFRKYLETETDQHSLHTKLRELFEHLDTADYGERPIPKALQAFPYVNGGLFRQDIRIPGFTQAQRKLLLDCTDFNWEEITPEIFGSIFQSALDPKKRAEKGQHYTSAENILKVLKPLFLDSLETQLNDILKDTSDERTRRLYAFQDKLSKIHVLDPACGCGNFLVVAYQQLRLLELTVLKELKENVVVQEATKVSIGQFYGIEIEDFPHEVAKLSLWLMELICNKRAAREFQQRFASIPLRSNDNIHCADALEINWETVLAAKDCSYIAGNPPFVRHKQKKKEQGQQLKRILGTKDADYVCAWYKLAAQYMAQNKNIRAALVSTNSVCQGKHPELLWKPLFADGIGIDFFYETFKWSNEAKNVAAVHCIIVGFRYSISPKEKRAIYSQEAKEDGTLQIVKKEVSFISAYGMASPNVIVCAANKPLSAPLPMRFGNMPADGGNLIIEEAEYEQFIFKEPKAKKFIKRLYGAEEFINNTKRFCLWLVNATTKDINAMPLVKARVAACKRLREKSTQPKLAERPHLFRDCLNPDTAILIPCVSSESRRYIPLGFIDSSSIASNAAQIVAGAGKFEFGILTSQMHMAWMRFVCGRLEMRYRYSKDLCYNTFYWPEATDDQKQKVETLARKVLYIRDQRAMEGLSLADLYDGLTPDPELMKAHAELDRCVDRLYRKGGFKNDQARIEFLAEKYKDISGQSSEIKV